MISDDDRKKFEYLYDKHKKLMLYISYKILKDLNLAEDATSDAFIRIYQNIYKIEDPDSPMTVSYIATIVRNASITLLNKRRKHIMEELPDSLEENFDLEEIIISDMILIEIYKALDNLDEDSKSIFLLKFTHGFSTKEIEKILNLNESTIRTKLHRAKKKLAKLTKLVEKECGHETRRYYDDKF